MLEIGLGERELLPSRVAFRGMVCRSIASSTPAEAHAAFEEDLM